MSILHLFFHRLLTQEYNGQSVLLKKEVMNLIQKHLKIKSSVTLRVYILNEMINAGLLENVNQHKVRLINKDKSKSLDNIIEGNWRSQRRTRL